MLDHAGDTPTAPPPESFLIALQGGGKLRVTRVDDGRLHSHAVRRVIADEYSDGPGVRAEPNGQGGYHVGRHTLVAVDLGDAGTGPITWERFASENAEMGKGELRIIFADLAATGEHRGGGGAQAEFTVRLVLAENPSLAPETFGETPLGFSFGAQCVSPIGLSSFSLTAEVLRALTPLVEQGVMSEARIAAEAELARLDAACCHLAQARRRYTADTACNAWSLEQATRDVVRAAEAVTQAFARRSELA